MKKLSSILVFCYISIISIESEAQALVNLDPSPFERPIPFGSIDTENPIDLLSELIDTLANYHFQISKIDKNSFFFEAKRLDTEKDNAEDRILIWLERDPMKPLKSVDIFLIYGRFEVVWTDSGKELTRIKVDDFDEDRRTGGVKKAITKIIMR